MFIKVGDYLAADHTVFLKVVAVLENDITIVGFTNPKNPSKVQWHTHDELLSQKMSVRRPDFDKWASLKIGDLIAESEDTYLKVLHREGAAVLLSEPPNAGAKGLADFFDHLADDHDIKIADKSETKMLRDMASLRKSLNRAGDWWDVETLALMNWKIIEDENAN